MKPILIVIKELGAYNYLEPVIEKLLSNKKRIYIYIDEKLKNFNKINLNLHEVSRMLFHHEIQNINLKHFSIVISSATGKKIENEVIKKAAKFKVPSIQFVDNIYGWKRRLSYNKKTVFPDHLAVINYQCKKLAYKEGVPYKIIKIVGHPAWEKIRYIFSRKNTNTIFVGSPINELYKNKLGYTEKEVWDMCIKVNKNSNVENVKTYSNLKPKIYF